MHSTESQVPRSSYTRLDSHTGLGQDSRTFDTLKALVSCPATAYVRVCRIAGEASHLLLACEPSCSTGPAVLRVCRGSRSRVLK